MAERGADVVCISGIVWHLRDALALMPGLPECDDYHAVEEGLNEVLNAAEAWLQECNSNPPEVGSEVLQYDGSDHAD